MKAKRLTIKNIRAISNETIEFNKPLILLYGDVRQGKTTFLDSIKILFTKGFPSDLIKHGEKEASIELELENGFISRSFYINKNNEVIGRPLSAMINNKKVGADYLFKMFNPFQFNQDYLINLTTTERRKFFIDLFNIDTKDIDNTITEKEEKAKELRIQIKTFGEIEIEEIEKPDIEGLKEKEEKELQKIEKEKESKKNEIKERENKIRADLNKKVLEIRQQNKELKEKYDKDTQKELERRVKFNKEQDILKQIVGSYNHYEQEFSSYPDYIKKYIDIDLFKSDLSKLKQPEDQLPLNFKLDEPGYLKESDIDTSTLDNVLKEYQEIKVDESNLNLIRDQISDSKANLIKYNGYLEKVKKQQEKQGKIKELSDTELEIRNLRKDKVSKLQQYAKEIDGLLFNSNGTFTYQGFADDNISTSQFIELGQKLTKLFKNTLLDLELIDRGESLGKSIFNYIDKAKNENKTILATIVGEKPTQIPDEIGVFVVEKGKLND